ncbi:hypothetical protein ACTP1G_01365 [Streptococcus milleri]
MKRDNFTSSARLTRQTACSSDRPPGGRDKFLLIHAVRRADGVNQKEEKLSAERTKQTKSS